MNKKGVEALPLRYIIIALVAALVIGIALQFVGTLKGGTLAAAEKMNETLTEKTTCALDDEAPEITIDEGKSYCNSTTDILHIEATITDECGVDEDKVAVIDSHVDEWVDMTLSDDVWIGEINATEFSKNYIDNEILNVTISAFDKADQPNQGVETTQITCKP